MRRRHDRGEDCSPVDAPQRPERERHRASRVASRQPTRIRSLRGTEVKGRGRTGLFVKRIKIREATSQRLETHEETGANRSLRKASEARDKCAEENPARWRPGYLFFPKCHSGQREHRGCALS